MGFLNDISKSNLDASGKSVVPTGTQPYQTPFVDTFRKRTFPRGAELIRECLGTAYTCATLNSDLVASASLRLYVRTKRGQSKSRLSQRGKTAAVPRATMKWLQKSRVTASLVSGADVEEVVDHAALDLLHSPNGDGTDGVGFSLYELIELTQRYLEIVGKAYWYTPRDGLGDTPTQIWVLPPQFVQEIPGMDSEKMISRYRYAGSGMRTTDYRPEEVVPFRVPDAMNPYTGGSSPMKACFEQVLIFREFSAQTLALLENGGRPDAMWSPKGDEMGTGIGEDEAKRMRLAMRQAFAMSGRGGVFVSEFPGSIQPMTWSTNEIMSSQTADQLKTLIANCFQVPTTKLNRADATLASALTGDVSHARDAGLPRTNRFAATLNAFLLPMFDDPERRLFFAFDSCVPDDEAFKLTVLKDGVTVGAVLRQEYRDACGLPDAEWAKTPLAPSNFVAVDEAGKPVPPAQANPLAGLFGNLPGPTATSAPDTTSTDKPAAGPEDKPADAATQMNCAQISSALQIVMSVVSGDLPRDSGLAMLQQMFGMTLDQAESMMASAGKPNVSTTPNPKPDDAQADAPAAEPAAKAAKTVITQLNETADGLARPLPDGASIAGVLRNAFEQQRKFVLDALSAYAKGLTDAATKDESGKPIPPVDDDGLPTRFIPLNKWDESIAHEVKPLIELIAKNEGEKVLTRLGASPDVFAVFEKNIPAAAQELTLKFCKATNATTSMQLDDALATLRQEIGEGVVEGDSVKELTTRVNAIFDQATNERAATIAKTEASRATHNGELIGARDSGVVSGKGWLASADACDVCLGYAAKGFIPLDATFAEVGGEYGSIDGPPSHPKCECSLIYKIDDPQS